MTVRAGLRGFRARARHRLMMWLLCARRDMVDGIARRMDTLKDQILQCVVDKTPVQARWR